MTETSNINHFKVAPFESSTHSLERPDTITTEIVRHALNSASKQMKIAAIRTSFSPIIYELLDFAVALYDRRIRLLGQAPTLPAFMGTMGFCIESAVEAVGGSDALDPGDIIVYNRPYGTGSHAQDCAVLMPIFTDNGLLVGYAANKAHWVDIGASAPYCTNTTNVYQEGVVIPGVKLYRKGQLDDSVYRFILANCRFQESLEGDMKSQIASLHVGARELLRLIGRLGLEKFETCVEAMFAHGEHVVREYIKKIPDGDYHATCHMDSNGIDDEPIQSEIMVRIQGDRAIFDFSNVPDAQKGPTNCPLPSTICASRITLAMLAGGDRETPNEGHFRPVEVITRPGSMYHPVEPQPCFLYGWALVSAMEGIFEAFAKATGGSTPSGSAADVGTLVYYGTDHSNGKSFYQGTAVPVGHGALPHGDGSTLFVAALANSQIPSPELEEAKLPIFYEKWELTPDTCGPGKYRGGMGWDMHFKMKYDLHLISTVERTKRPGWAQQGGHSGTPNKLEIKFADGRSQVLTKVTDLHVPAGSLICLSLGGGGGYGPPAERARAAIERDIQDELTTERFAEIHYGLETRRT